LVKSSRVHPNSIAFLAIIILTSGPEYGVEGERSFCLPYVMGLPRLRLCAIFPNDFNQKMTRHGVNSVALVHRQKLIGCKLLK